MPPNQVDGAKRRREAKLLRRYRASRDARTRERLVQVYQPLAKSLAHRYYSGGEPFEDLLQIANVGLLKALDGFDPDIGKPFPAYATPTILGELRHYFRDQTWGVRLPRQLQERSMRVTAAIEALQSEEGEEPTPQQVAKWCDLEVEEVLEAMVADASRRTKSLDAPAQFDGAESAPVVDFVESKEPGFDRAESNLAASRTALLPPERRVMDLRFRAEMTQREVGDELGISQMQVSRLQRSALLKLLGAVRGGDEEPGDLMRRLAPAQGSTATAE